MDEQTLLERLIAGRVNAVLDEVLTILETDDGKSFEEKRKKLINFSAQKSRSRKLPAIRAAYRM